jgi:starch phosphorylase
MTSRVVRDPVRVRPDVALRHDVDGVGWFFCSEVCRSRFAEDPVIWTHEFPLAEPDAPASRVVAWFSMEVALSAGIHTYSGGLGVLAGDLLRSAADLEVPLVAVSLVSSEGYFRQRLDGDGQHEAPDPWRPWDYAERTDAVVQVQIQRRIVRVGAWRTWVTGARGAVPVLLLDTDQDGNDPTDRAITRRLYGGDAEDRLAQEIVLGVGGARMLAALGYDQIRRWHMNEGHAALLGVELLRHRRETVGGEWDFDAVRNRCVFTTHTPVPAGHDRVPWELVDRVLGEPIPGDLLRMLGGDAELNMTRLGLSLSHFVNGVARRHQEVSAAMFPASDVAAITNGVHATTWTSAPFAALFDRRIPHWRDDPQALRSAVGLPDDELWAAHAAARDRLHDELERRAPGRFRRDVLTIGFARRATAYKRPELVLADLDRLRALARDAGPLQIVFAGKAHPDDEGGRERIRRVQEAARALGDAVPVAWLEGYDLDLARLLTSGVDVWLNTPLAPLEASGTSGMKAAHNGVPHLSVRDGWWVEGHIEGVTGWSIDGGPDGEAASLYAKLESAVLPRFHDRAAWADVMRGAIAFSASYFNSHRMVAQYAACAWL